MQAHFLDSSSYFIPCYTLYPLPVQIAERFRFHPQKKSTRFILKLYPFVTCIKRRKYRFRIRISLLIYILTKQFRPIFGIMLIQVVSATTFYTSIPPQFSSSTPSCNIRTSGFEAPVLDVHSHRIYNSLGHCKDNDPNRDYAEIHALSPYKKVVCSSP